MMLKPYERVSLIQMNLHLNLHLNLQLSVFMELYSEFQPLFSCPACSEVGGDFRAKRRVKIGLTFIRWAKTQL